MRNRTEYYLKVRDQELYLSGHQLDPSSWRGHKTYQWGPNPQMFQSMSHVRRLLEDILVDHFVRGRDVPICDIVEQEFVPGNQRLYSSKLTRNTALISVVSEKFDNRELTLAFESSLRYVQDGKYWTHAIRRTGGKQLVEDQFGNRAYTYNFYSFFSNDDDVMVAKLLLGDHFREIIDLAVVNEVLTRL